MYKRQLARTLNQRRRARGSVEIDLPEARIAVDGQGEVTDVTAPDRGEAERLIEECMLCLLYTSESPMRLHAAKSR